MPRLSGCQEVELLSFPSITAAQIAEGLLAIPAFVPALVCPGYLAAWYTNLHGFRQRTMVERLFWSVPLSLAISPIACVLIGKAFSLDAAVALLAGCAVAWLAVLWREGRELREQGRHWNIGFRPLGGVALAAALAWIAVAVLSLVDLEWGHKLFMNVAMLDQCFRVDWTQSVLRTGVPPVNSMYSFHHPATMRNYYFWYVLCAAVARMAHLPARAVFLASCVWSGFGLAALTGLYLKHFLAVGARLRRQFLQALLLFTVTGVDICFVAWQLVFYKVPPPADLEAWSKDAIVSWLHTLLWAPHHMAGMLCCMFAFLLAWLAGRDESRHRAVSVLLMAAALASAFGLSVYVAFAFFLLVLAWGAWQLLVERAARPAWLLAMGGAGAVILLAPYLWELTHGASGLHGGSVLGFAIREMIPPDGLAASSLLQHLSPGHPLLARALAKLILLAPGYAIELGFFFVVLLVYLVPAWRGRVRLTSPQRALVFLAVAIVPLLSAIRSDVLSVNDFGWRAALLLQFPLLLLASEVLICWRMDEKGSGSEAEYRRLPRHTPHWLRGLAALALVIGMMDTAAQAVMLRLIVTVGERHISEGPNPAEHSFAHNAYISAIGYAQMNRVIPRDATVQFNPGHGSNYWLAADLLGSNHQAAIVSDRPFCGAELGGDPAGCAAMAAEVDALYRGDTAEQARAACGALGIQYLVARISDPAW
ncbi:MAG TPA: hypothetical protein VMV57_14010, partial [Terracidiphilus sp.]|nr:hypothetical protein [Terracidiphilus sp.]